MQFDTKNETEASGNWNVAKSMTKPRGKLSEKLSVYWWLERLQTHVCGVNGRSAGSRHWKFLEGFICKARTQKESRKKSGLGM